MGRVGDMVVVGEREPVTVAWGSWRAAWRCCWWSWGVKCVKRGLVKNHWKACYPVRTSKSKGTHSLLCGRLLLFNCCGVWLSCDSMDYSPEFPDSSVGKESACNAGDPGSIPVLGRSTGEEIGYPFQYSWASLVAQLVKNLPAMRETWVWSLGWEDPLEKAKATNSSILAWRISWPV